MKGLFSKLGIRMLKIILKTSIKSILKLGWRSPQGFPVFLLPLQPNLPVTSTPGSVRPPVTSGPPDCLRPRPSNPNPQNTRFSLSVLVLFSSSSSPGLSKSPVFLSLLNYVIEPSTFAPLRDDIKHTVWGFTCLTSVPGFPDSPGDPVGPGKP